MNAVELANHERADGGGGGLSLEASRNQVVPDGTAADCYENCCAHSFVSGGIIIVRLLFSDWPVVSARVVDSRHESKWQCNRSRKLEKATYTMEYNGQSVKFVPLSTLTDGRVASNATAGHSIAPAPLVSFVDTERSVESA